MSTSYYNIEQIKNKSIMDYLNENGIRPSKYYNGYALFNAPYREDDKASLKVDYERNLWYDFGLSKGGSIIDLVMLLHNYSLREALAHLSNGIGNKERNFSFYRIAQSRNTSTRQILDIRRELPPYLENYLQEERKIKLALVRTYLYSIRYEIKGRSYSAIAFPNRAGGYELRNSKTFKGTIAPKDISILNEDTDCTSLNIFEGFIDFLSYCTLKGDTNTAPSLVLNSVSNIGKAVAYIKDKDIRYLRAFLDNDLAGDNTLKELQCIGVKVEDMRSHYANHKDLNAYLIGKENESKQEVRPNKKGLRR